MNFRSWNDPGTPEDETVDTFATLAYKFCAHAEMGGSGYREPLKRMTQLLGLFDEDLELRYDRHNNTAQADSFRATLMVTALSYGFDSDLRNEFIELNFPICFETYDELMDRVINVQAEELPALKRMSAICWPNPCNPYTIVSYRSSRDGLTTVCVHDLEGRLVRRLQQGEQAAGLHEVAWDGADGTGRQVASGVYLIRVTEAGEAASTKVVLLR